MFRRSHHKVANKGQQNEHANQNELQKTFNSWCLVADCVIIHSFESCVLEVENWEQHKAEARLCGSVELFPYKRTSDEVNQVQEA